MLLRPSLSSGKLLILSTLLFVALANTRLYSHLFAFAKEGMNPLFFASLPLVHASLLFLILLPFSSRFTLKPFLSIAIGIAALSSYFMNRYGTVISHEMVQNVMQTDRGEALELINTDLLLHLFVWVVFPLALLWSIRLKKESWSEALFFRLKWLIGIIFFLLLVITTLGKSYFSFFRNHSDFRLYTNPTYPLYSTLKYFALQHQLPTPQTIQAIGMDAHMASHEEKKRLVLFIVGETARAANFSLGGYLRETNPLLAKQEVLFLPQFYSCGTATAISLPCLFSDLTQSQYSDKKSRYRENLLDVLQRAGVRIIWHGNNSGFCKGVCNRIADTLNYSGEVFDEKLLEGLDQKLEKKYQDTFIVLHQEGSHGPTYYKRYPSAFAHFTPACNTSELQKCSQEELINVYDNTILYTDFLLSRSIEWLKNYQDRYQVALIYVSDHGESLGENGIYLHGLPYTIAPDEQKRVGALAWMGKDLDSYKQALKSRQNDQLSHDYLFSSLLHLANVATTVYNPDLDFFLPKD